MTLAITVFTTGIILLLLVLLFMTLMEANELRAWKNKAKQLMIVLQKKYKIPEDQVLDLFK
jgi:hypothetical protein